MNSARIWFNIGNKTCYRDMGDLKELWVKRTWFFRITISATITCRDRKIQLLDKAPQPGNQDEWQPWGPREGSTFLNSVSKFCALKTWGCCKNWQFLKRKCLVPLSQWIGVYGTTWKKINPALEEKKCLISVWDRNSFNWLRVPDITVRYGETVPACRRGIGVVQSHQLMSQL